MPPSPSPFRPRALSRAACALALLSAGASHAATVSGSAALTSDYVWRGTTQTAGDPALQAGFRYAGDSGAYVSAWGSNVEFAPGTRASSEFDLALGWSGAVAPGWSLDLNLLRYQYPSATIDLNWSELAATLVHRDAYWLALAYSPDALGGDGRGLYAQIGAKLPLGARFRLEAAAARYDLAAYDGSYLHGQFSGVWTLKAPLELRVTAHATDSAAERIFGGDNAGGRIEAALQASF
ncbi:TorF family putative porin [Vulcaniibacterium tengchongense]|uniref:Uncharacterized protein (TIGR02001 family) n=1 Tax=Vulcaniibacterium tengchongense TaxID=1273429 RepID=A0A3N4V6D6_9GAMM|nr:TorF family putative porin [Vulcaniibacterium tengchongense]RPE76895.1 uncharacterized protein (TIGR02001 family) [Vulcaniibacterium tengchongense]